MDNDFGAATTIQCATCGVERVGDALPDVCPICADERQFVPPGGQEWTSTERAGANGASLEIVEFEPRVLGIRQHRCPGIGQVPILLQTDAGNVLLEAPNYFDDAVHAEISRLGGVEAIVPSHPHMYGLQSVWSRAFGGAPVFISAADEEWLGVRPENTVVWDGETEILPGVRASQPGGHFPGSNVVHWTAPDGAGVLFAGDTIGPVRDTGWVTFMRSYPNWIPLSAAVVRRIAEHVSRYEFDRLYGNFGGSVLSDASGAVHRSADRYAAWVSGVYDDLT